MTAPTQTQEPEAEPKKPKRSRYDIFSNEIAGDYDFRRTTEGAYIVVPTDPERPYAAESLEYLIPEWQERLAEFGVDTFGQAKAVFDMARAQARAATQSQERTELVVRVHQYSGADDLPRVLIDLGDPRVGLVIHIGPGGWYVHDPREEGGPHPDSPVWHREPDFQPLPIPDTSTDRVPGAGKAWLNTTMALDDRDWHLVWLWLMSTYFPLWDQQGLMFITNTQLGKSLRARWLLRFLHPPAPEKDGIGGAFPTTEREWGSRMHKAPVMAFDDAETISAAQHQAMKQLSTGARFETQTLYETRGTTITEGKRPMLITASGTPAGYREDLRNRVWIISPTRPPVGANIKREFERWAPLIFADLLDDLVTALRGLPQALAEMDAILAAGNPVRPREIRALARALDDATPAPTARPYERAMLAERQESLEAAAEEDRFASTVVKFVRDHPEGGQLSNDQLLIELQNTALEKYNLDDGALERAQWFPQDTGRMGSWLGRKADSLAAVGVVFHAHRGAKGARYRTWDPLPDAPASTPVAEHTPILTVNHPGPLAGPTLEGDNT